MIQNPVLPGFNPDPCICRRGDDYYLAVSSFEWLPAIPVYHSRDLKNWELLTHILDDKKVNLQGIPSAKGLWAPCLTWSETDGLFYLVYGIMNSMNARYFDIDNYLITAPDITGPWSDPVYIHSAGFDASLLHDDDGRKYIVTLEWETREGYEQPGKIDIVEYDPKQEKCIGYPVRIWGGATDRGCLEAPHLTKRNGYYYLMCAEGGTGYNHCVSMARARSPFGPYEADPIGAIVTSNPYPNYERNQPDHLKPYYYNPNALLQKCGHGSYVDLPNGETYLFHLCSRPFVPEELSKHGPTGAQALKARPDLTSGLRCTLGRETAIQKMLWTEDGWLRMADGTNLAKASVPEASLPEVPVSKLLDKDDFDIPVLRKEYSAPRQMPVAFCDLAVRPGYVRLRGGEALSSLNKASLLARRLTSLHAQVTTKMEFSPEIYQHSAGLVLYYDNMNYAFLRKYYSVSLSSPALMLIHVENGIKKEYTFQKAVCCADAVWLKLEITGRSTRFSYSEDGKNYRQIGEEIDTSLFSDEYSQYGEFTGTMVGIACEDRMYHAQYADFDFFEYKDL